MYIHNESATKFKKDVADFISGSEKKFFLILRKQKLIVSVFVLPVRFTQPVKLPLGQLKMPVTFP
jgi:hypothetical protein